jgi:pimeloyl-ACP methyl ester carboxylesterase
MHPLAAAVSVSGPMVPPMESRLFALRNVFIGGGMEREVLERVMALWQRQFASLAAGSPLSLLDPDILAARATLPASALPPLSADYVPQPTVNSLTFERDDRIRELTVPYLALFGELDQVVPVERSVARLRELLPARSATPVEIVVLPGVGHSLDVPSGARHPEYVPRVMAWLERYLRAP